MKNAVMLTLAAIAAFACPAAWAQHAVPLTAPDPGANRCEPPVYPMSALRLEQSGIVEAGFLVGADGIVRERVVVHSSGVAVLDSAAVDALAKCRFKPAIVDGQPVARWTPVRYVWKIEDTTASPQLLARAQGGSPTIQYMLAMMYDAGFIVPKSAEHAHRWTRVAAERGHPMAQFKLGLAYETGCDCGAETVTKDEAQAVLWYRKAAAQKNVFAQQKLQFGFGSVAPEPEAQG